MNPTEEELSKERRLRAEIDKALLQAQLTIQIREAEAKRNQPPTDKDKRNE